MPWGYSVARQVRPDLRYECTLARNNHFATFFLDLVAKALTVRAVSVYGTGRLVDGDKPKAGDCDPSFLGKKSPWTGYTASRYVSGVGREMS